MKTFTPLGIGGSPTPRPADTNANRMAPPCDTVIELVSELTARYQLSALEPLLASCRAARARDVINIAVGGRFKAGKSSFLNHLLGRSLLPAGVVPVTAVIAGIGYGAREKAVVHFLDGHSEEVSLGATRGFVAESENPENSSDIVSSAFPSIIELDLSSQRNAESCLRLRALSDGFAESIYLGCKVCDRNLRADRPCPDRPPLPLAGKDE